MEEVVWAIHKTYFTATSCSMILGTMGKQTKQNRYFLNTFYRWTFNRMNYRNVTTLCRLEHTILIACTMVRMFPVIVKLNPAPAAVHLVVSLTTCLSWLDCPYCYFSMSLTLSAKFQIHFFGGLKCSSSVSSDSSTFCFCFTTLQYLFLSLNETSLKSILHFKLDRSSVMGI